METGTQQRIQRTERWHSRLGIPAGIHPASAASHRDEDVQPGFAPHTFSLSLKMKNSADVVLGCVFSCIKKTKNQSECLYLQCYEIKGLSDASVWTLRMFVMDSFGSVPGVALQTHTHTFPSHLEVVEVENVPASNDSRSVCLQVPKALTGFILQVSTPTNDYDK